MNDRDRPHRPELERREAEGPVVVDLHEPIYREMAEPRDGYEPAPSWLVFLCLFIMGFGGWYLGMYSGAFSPKVYNENPAAGVRSAPPAAPRKIDPKVLGRRVFNNCMSCHQQDGQGVPDNYPPLAGSEWANGRADVAAAIVLHGLEGPIEVEGRHFNQVMPSWKHLTDEQLAAVLTYVRGSWGNSGGPVKPALVAAVRKATGEISRSLRAEDLMRFKAGPPLGG